MRTISMWRKIVTAIVFVLSLAACTPSEFSLLGADPGRKCADLAVKFYTTDGTTKGIFACLGSDLQNRFRADAIHDDAGLAGRAAMHSSQFVIHDLHNKSGDSYVYRVWEQDSNGNVVIGTYIVILTDPHGKIVKLTTAQ